jgi:hypothetical protein
MSGEVDADHVVAEFMQVGAVAAGAAGRVQCRADGQVVQDVSDNGLLDVDHLIAGGRHSAAPRFGRRRPC